MTIQEVIERVKDLEGLARKAATGTLKDGVYVDLRFSKISSGISEGIVESLYSVLTPEKDTYQLYFLARAI
jgi:hypothetical protein